MIGVAHINIVAIIHLLDYISIHIILQTPQVDTYIVTWISMGLDRTN